MIVIKDVNSIIDRQKVNESRMIGFISQKFEKFQLNKIV